LKGFFGKIKDYCIKDTTRTILLVAILVALYIVLNLWMQTINLAQIDLTKDKLYTLTDQSKNIAKKIDKEMNDPEAFYYKNAHTYLTKNYIVNFMSTFEAIPYKDVIWVYKYELRQNGIKSQQNVQVMTRDGKNHAIATLTGLTKKANDVFNEILETVAERCTNALIGYTKENRAKVNELIVKPEKKKKKQ